MKAGMNIQELAAEISRQNEAKVDYIAPTVEMQMVAYEGKAPSVQLNGHGEFGLTDRGHATIAQRMGIPMRYYDRMRSDYPALLAMNVNGWAKQEPKDVMFRTMDGNVRAMLSNAYRRMDNQDFLEAILPAIGEASDGQLEAPSSQVTEDYMYVQMTFPHLEHEFKVNRGGRQVGEVVRAGLIISNSEVGMGSRRIQMLIYTLACTNGMVTGKEIDSLTTRHLGRRQGAGQLAHVMSDEAIHADNRALALATRDYVRAMMDKDALVEIANKMQSANERRITGQPEQAVKVLGQQLRLSEGEQGSVLRHLIDGGDLSQYGLLNAVTRTAEDVKSYDRAIELETMGGVILEMPKRQLEPVLTAKAV